MEFLTAENLIALLTLTSLEIVLGIDNIVFLAILTAKLPPEKQRLGRQVGLGLAMGARILLLLSLTWVMKLTKVLFTVAGHEVTGKDLVLLLGGLFLLAKATFEIHERVEGHGKKQKAGKGSLGFGAALVQIVILDIVFSLDSVITAVGMAREIWVMVTAVVVAVIVMMIFASRVTRFIERHPTVKMLALSFLLLIGVLLVAEGLGQHIPKGYVYFAMGFSLFVEMLNLRAGSQAAKAEAGVKS